MPDAVDVLSFLVRLTNYGVDVRAELPPFWYCVSRSGRM